MSIYMAEQLCYWPQPEYAITVEPLNKGHVGPVVLSFIERLSALQYDHLGPWSVSLERGYFYCVLFLEGPLLEVPLYMQYIVLVVSDSLFLLWVHVIIVWLYSPYIYTWSQCLIMEFIKLVLHWLYRYIIQVCIRLYRYIIQVCINFLFPIITQ